VAFPPDGPAGGPYRAIRARGNLPILVEDCLLAELPARALEESWSSAAALSDADMAAYCRRAANRLARAFDGGLPATDLADVVANAAVLFVIALRTSGVRSPRAIRPCTVTYDGSLPTGQVTRAS
jgi:hypothetical protein